MNKKTIFFLGLLSAMTIQNFALSTPLVEDEIVNKHLKNRAIPKPETVTKYNFQDTTKIPVKIHLIVDIKSEKDIWEGETVYFKSVQNVYYNHTKVIEKGQIIPAKVETIITSGMNGIPASIIFGDFQINNISQGQITESFEKFGQDRSLWVYPLKWALTFLPPTGSLTNFIKGGHARLKSDEVITIYYHPKWI